MRIPAVFISFLLFFASCAFAQKQVVTPQVSPTLKFTENLGQWAPSIKYRMQLDGGLLFMESDGMTYNLYDKKKFRAFHTGGIAREKEPVLDAHAFKVEFMNCNHDFKTEASQQGSDYENFYIGSDRTKWKSNVRNYHNIWYRNIYKDIDYEAITSSQGLKYNFHVKAGADPSLVRLKYKGVEKIKLLDEQLIVTTSVGNITEKKPYAYQSINGQIVEVPCKFALRNNTVSFDFPKGYNAAYDLIIDPILVFAAQSGSTADNFGMTATYDNGGNLYSGGTAFDIGYPTTPGAYQITFAATYTPNTGNTDVVVTKYNPTGTGLVFSTYLGGKGSEIVTSLIVDASNNLYLYGATGSINFPTTTGAYDNSFNGGSYLSFVFNGTEFTGGTDIYVAKFNPTGTALLGSTYIGGSGNDGVNHNNALINYNVTLTFFCPPASGTFNLTEYKADSLQYNYGDQYRGEIQLDKLGNVYIASSTRSSNFPIVGGFDNTLNGKQDAVIVKLNPSLSSILWSSFLGGSGNDAGYSLVVDDTLNVYATGGTYSTDFPTKPGCYQTSYNGGKADGYIVKINPTGNAILKGTYIGTSDYDQSYFVQNDKLGNIYIYGQSLGSMPVIGPVYSNPGSHQFISRLDVQLSSMNLSTVFGSGNPKLDISPSAFAVDICGNIYVSGWGGNIIFGPSTSGMPVTPGAFQTSSPNGYDFYLMALSKNAASLVYGTYFGGACSKEHVDGGTSRFDKKGIIYQSVCAGCGGFDDFPVTPGAWPGTPGNPNHNTDNNNCNNGVFKFDFQIKSTNVTINTSTISGCAPLTVNFNNPTYGGGTFQWYFGPGDVDNTVLNPVKTFTNPGNYTVTLVVKDSSSCNKIDSAITYINVLPGIKADFTVTPTGCGSDTLNFANTSVPTAPSVLQTINWNFGASTYTVVTPPSQTYSTSGTYNATLTVSNNFGCRDSIVKNFIVNIFDPGVVKGDTICQEETASLSASGGTSYTWTPSGSLSSANSASPTASPSVTTIYSVAITNTLSGCSKTLTTQVVVNPKPTANFTYSLNPCGGGLYCTDQSTGATQWNWDFGSLQTSTVQNAYNFYSNGGNYNVSLIVSNNFGCSDTIKKSVTVGTPPPVSVSASTVLCLGGSVKLSASGGFAYSWSPASSLSSPTSATTIATPAANTTYSVDVTTTNSIGDTCHLLLTDQVSVYQISTTPVSITASPDTIVLGNSSILTVNASPGAVVAWSPPGSINPLYGYSVTASPQVTTTYTAVITRGPCTQNLKITVWVLDDQCSESDVYIPNTFTPNGDGQNDIMYVRGPKISELYFAIYNRWGEMVFETKDKNIGWDGIYKGRQADVGVFGYYVKAKCFNGLETFRKGNITLIR